MQRDEHSLSSKPFSLNSLLFYFIFLASVKDSLKFCQFERGSP